jgi:hypothetical protein
MKSDFTSPGMGSFPKAVDSESLREAAHGTGWHAMHRDLELLVGELEAAGALLQRLAEEVRALHRLEHESLR